MPSNSPVIDLSLPGGNRVTSHATNIGYYLVGKNLLAGGPPIQYLSNIVSFRLPFLYVFKGGCEKVPVVDSVYIMEVYSTAFDKNGFDPFPKLCSSGYSGYLFANH